MIELRDVSKRFGTNVVLDRVNLSVEDIHAVHARLVAAGVVFTRPPEREDWGGHVATFSDPDGNVVQLMQVPPA